MAADRMTRCLPPVGCFLNQKNNWLRLRSLLSMPKSPSFRSQGAVLGKAISWNLGMSRVGANQKIIFSGWSTVAAASNFPMT